MKPLKEKELRQHAKCAHCGLKLGQTGLPLFYLVTIARHGIKLDAVTRKAGLEMTLGNPFLAAVMGPDEDMTVPLMEPTTITICERCSTNPMMVAELAELANMEKELNGDKTLADK